MYVLNELSVLDMRECAGEEEGVLQPRGGGDDELSDAATNLNVTTTLPKPSPKPHQQSGSRISVRSTSGYYVRKDGLKRLKKKEMERLKMMVDPLRPSSSLMSRIKSNSRSKEGVCFQC